MSNQPYLPNSNGSYLATSVYEADGSDYVIGFPFLSQGSLDAGEISPYIKAFYISTEGTVSTPAFSMPTPYLVRFATPVTGGTVLIRRDSSVNGRGVSYASGATLNQSTLEIDSLQAFYLYEELADRLLDAYETNEDSSKFNAFFSIEGDGVTTSFRLEDDDFTVDQDLSEVGVWCFIGGAFVAKPDYSLSQDTDGVVVVEFARALENGEKGEIRVAQIQAIAATIADGEITAEKLAPGFVDSLTDFDLDGQGSGYQVLGWDNDSANSFGAQTLTHDWVSDFDDAVEAKSLSDFAAPTANIDWNGKKITNLLDPTADQDAATKAYVDDQIGDASVSPTAAGTLTFSVNATQTVDLGFPPKWIRVRFKYYTFDAVNFDGFDSDLPASLTVSPKLMSISLSGNILSFQQTGSGSGADGIVDYAVIG